MKKTIIILLTLALCLKAGSIDGYDRTVLNIILESVGAYYAGNKTAEETVRIIQSKAGVYLAERYG